MLELIHTFICFLKLLMYLFYHENTLYMYIEFDNTDYTRCLAVSISTASIQIESVSLEGMHNRRNDWSAFA